MPIILITVLIAQLVTTSNQAERPLVQGEDTTARPALHDVITLLKKRARGESVTSVGPVSLAGFNYSRVLELGGGRALVVISCNLGGGLMAFAPDGQLLATRRTWEQRSVQLADLDHDDQDEVITVELDEVGTGLVGWRYHIYRLSSDGWKQLWSAVSYLSIKIGAKAEIREGFLRLSDLDRNHVRLVYAARSGGAGLWTTSEWVLQGGTFKHVPSAGNGREAR